MSIVRTNKNKNYTVISNEVFLRTDLSAKAKGLYGYLMTKPDDWKIYKGNLKDSFTDGRESISTAFKELEDAGYIKRTILRSEEGTYKGCTYDVYENAGMIEPPEPEKPKSELPKSGNPKPDTTQLLNTDIPSTDKLNTEELKKIDKKDSDTDIQEDPEKRNYTQEWETLRKYWGEITGAVYRKPLTHQPNPAELANSMQYYSLDEMKAAIENNQKNKDAGIYGYISFPNFILKGLDTLNPDAYQEPGGGSTPFDFEKLPQEDHRAWSKFSSLHKRDPETMQEFEAWKKENV